MKISNLQEKYCTWRLSIDSPSALKARSIKILIFNLLETESRRSSYWIDFKIYFKHEKYNNVVSVRLELLRKNQHWDTKKLFGNSSKNTGIQQQQPKKKKSENPTTTVATHSAVLREKVWYVYENRLAHLKTSYLQERGRRKRRRSDPPAPDL